MCLKLISKWILATFLITLCLVSAGVTEDARYPNHTVRIIAPSNPGGNPDILARMLADRMGRDFDVPFIVENLSGAGGAIPALAVAKSPADGYTLFIGESGIMAINPLLNPTIGYGPDKDFTPITGLSAVPTVLVANLNVPAATLADFIALAKKEPGKISYGTPGVGSIHYMTMMIFADQVGIDLLHVPYRSGTDVVNGLLTGEIQVAWSGIPNTLQQIASGQLRGYCISVLKRSASMPEIPTCDELGVKGFHVASVNGLYAPAGTSPQIVARLQAEVAKVMREPAINARMEQLGMIMQEDGTANYIAFTKRDYARYEAIVQKLHLQIKN